MPPVGRLDTFPLRRAKELVGDQGIIAPWIQGVFNEVSFWYRRLDDLIMDAVLQPDFYHDLMTFCLGRVFRLVEQYIAADVDVLSAGETSPMASWSGGSSLLSTSRPMSAN